MAKKTNKNRSFLNRGVYLLPNLCTTLALAFGFLSINASFSDRFDQAAIFIVVAAIMDALDGRVARLTNTQSDFGAEFDSLSDMVSFGVAPAILIHTWNLHEYGKFGIMIAFLFALAIAIRLARFNVKSKSQKTSSSFEGLPSPASAVALVAPIWYLSSIGISGENLALLSLLMVLINAPLIVSVLPYPSFKRIGFRKVVSFWQALLLLIAMVLIVVEPSLMIMIYSWTYLTLALFVYLFKSKEKNPASEKDHQDQTNRTVKRFKPFKKEVDETRKRTKKNKTKLNNKKKLTTELEKQSIAQSEQKLAEKLREQSTEELKRESNKQ